MASDTLPDSSPRELLLWLFRLRRRMRVSGASMIPTLSPGDEVLVDPRAYAGREPQPGEIVVARRPDRQDVVLIKRVSGREQDGRFILHGDNPTASTDSDSFGPVAPQLLVGRVTSRFG